MPNSGFPPTPVRIGVDVGGTFTDLVCHDAQSGTLSVVKLPSTPPEFHRAVIDAVRQATGGRGATIVHGSTVATNALLQRAGEPAAFVTTEGFRDMLLIGRQNRPSLYALQVERPQPLTPEENWFTVRERISAQGEVVEALAEPEVDSLIQQIKARGLKHVAVCLLFSFINPVHEQLIGRKCAEAGLTVSLSSDILPEFREYERASTTVINACLRPTVREYLQALKRGLEEGLGFGVQGSVGEKRPDEGTSVGSASADAEPRLQTATSAKADPTNPQSSSVLNPERRTLNPSLHILHSGGGTLTVAEAEASAARLVLSGPAGGVLGAAFIASQSGMTDIITYDMGGTSTDVATVLDGRPQWTTSTTVDGLPIALPMFDIHTIGAGGGSVAWLDAGGALRVGPRSAGAVPGPACYERGGQEPTVTDANVVLGRILPDRFLGGAMRIDTELARLAVGKLAKAIGKGVVETALGVVRVAEANMEHAIRAVTSRRGHDPRQFTLVSFGGAGGLHACALAEALEIPHVLIPPYCGVLSALGMVVAPPVADASRTIVQLGDQLDDARLAAEYGMISGQTMEQIPYDRTDSVEVYADVRFRGQSHELKVRVERPSREHIAQRFVDTYRTQYGHVPAGKEVEIVTLRVRRIGKEEKIELPKLDRQTTKSDEREVEIYDSSGSRRTALALSRTEAVDKGIPGPLLIIDAEATTFVPDGWKARGMENGSVVLSRT